MSENRISADLPAETTREILAQLQSIRAALPFLTDLSTSEIRALPKLGDKSRAFVSKALEIAQQNPDFLPRSFEVEEMAKDVALFEALQTIRLSLSQLLELIDDTTTLAGSEAYAAALVVYNYAKATGRTQGLDAAVDELGRRFGRRLRPTSAETSA